MAALNLLFVCVGNTCRSPMAESIARGLGEGQVEASSAGIRPLGRVVRETSAALEALGYSSAGLRSKGLDDLDLEGFDVIISLLGEAGLSFLPRSLGAQLEAWAIPDPYGEDEEVYRNVGRLLEARIQEFLADHQKRELSLG